ncbi:2Fe-2S iron-sulfur cluster-binding protein [Buchnera aphidicola (Formosaphis micheliae)]|uniref:2Fe-2S iron-sulfur cluster-binding protein n=1 Tax=Buchnera aphidicola TaxID=9 RepID=UPI0031B85FBA
MQKINIKINDIHYIIKPKKKYISLLEIIEICKIPIEFQCRKGYCGVCRVKLIKGKFLLISNFNSTVYLHPGEILPCCCNIIQKKNMEIKIPYLS